MVQAKLKSKQAVSNLRVKKQSRVKGPNRPAKRKHLSGKEQGEVKLKKAIVNNIERIMAERVEEYTSVSKTRAKLELVKPLPFNPILDKGKMKKHDPALAAAKNKQP